MLDSLIAVSYTHLDVYKRQGTDSQYTDVFINVSAMVKKTLALT